MLSFLIFYVNYVDFLTPCDKFIPQHLLHSSDPTCISSWFSFHNPLVTHQQLSHNIASLPCDSDLTPVDLSNPLGSRDSAYSNLARAPGGMVGSLKNIFFQACRAISIQQHWRQHVKTRNVIPRQIRKDWWLQQTFWIFLPPSETSVLFPLLVFLLLPLTAFSQNRVCNLSPVLTQSRSSECLF